MLQLPAGEYEIPAGSLSPDGRYLAIEARLVTGLARLLVADIALGTVTVVPTPAASAIPAQPVWTPDSHRFFFSAGSPTGNLSASLWTYQLGDRTPTALRYLRIGPVAPLAVLPET